MASNTLDFDPAKVTFEDVAGRRKIIKSHFDNIGCEIQEGFPQRVAETLCKKVHASGRLKIGHACFEYMVDHTVCHNSLKCEMGLPVLEWPWPNRPKPDDDSMGLSQTYHDWLQRKGHEVSKNDENAIRALAMENRVNAATAIFDEEVAAIKSGEGKKRKWTMSLANDSEAPMLSDPVTLPVRSVPRVNIDKRALQVQNPSLYLRQQLWRSIMGQGVYQPPCVGPLEILVPTWLNFDGLVWGENGELYDQLHSTLHQFLTVGWITSGEKVVSLVVGFKPNREEESENHRQWQDLTTLWNDVVSWVGEVNIGTCTTLLESLTLSHWRRMFKVRHSQLPSLANYHPSNANLDAREEAMKRCNEEEALTPQIYAVLNQHTSTSVEGGLWAWICREVGDRRRRAMLATKIWVVVAAQNQSSAQVFQALEWEYNVMSSLDREIDGASSK